MHKTCLPGSLYQFKCRTIFFRNKNEYSVCLFVCLAICPSITLDFAQIGANRDHSAIHMINNPVGDSILLKARACGVPIAPNSSCLLTLHKLNTRQRYFRARSRSLSYKKRRAHLIERRYHLYDLKQNASLYVKDQLLPA